MNGVPPVKARSPIDTVTKGSNAAFRPRFPPDADLLKSGPAAARGGGDDPMAAYALDREEEGEAIEMYLGMLGGGGGGVGAGGGEGTA